MISRPLYFSRGIRFQEDNFSLNKMLLEEKDANITSTLLVDRDPDNYINEIGEPNQQLVMDVSKSGSKSGSLKDPISPEDPIPIK